MSKKKPNFMLLVLKYQLLKKDNESENFLKI